MANIPFQLSLQTSEATPRAQVPTSSLTPPVTPIAKRHQTPNPLDKLSQSLSAPRPNITTPLYFTNDLELIHNGDSRPVEFGRGAWSIVYKARSTQQITTALANTPSTPPGSPVSISRILAVKAPVRRDARAVLEAEAVTLTRLTLTPGHEPYIVPFHGQHNDLHGLVMTAIPLSLSTYIEDQADIARARQPATPTMFDPVQGTASYKALARKLIAGLNWLHQVAGMVHGDIKPHNILLRPVDADENSDVASSAFPFEPLFADFSSAVEIPDDPAVPLDTTRASMSAFTPPFTAPEMLASLTVANGDIAPTPASDVFSLAATLLAAATGDLLLYPGTSNMQRLAMARQGHQIVDLTRSGSSGHRVPRNGFVEKLVRPAVVKDPAMRISTRDWVDLAASVSS
ncbi:uncharacterized protein N7511_004524 [Penicillium nucicola]|uniref:uncharacterized protein n=1 Tax=Penicillium nucicola TaxID=1850975 RepID=UPI00254504B8|nr:uncharacterized protein N7511_004524 [Penicillium nucicola]KAJ5766908.1 hypothetical protein N7511_004524 [Penicillium nucicola]